MKCLVVGCGSIGTRRARQLLAMGHEVAGIDVDPIRLEVLIAEGVIKGSYADAYDAAFVCTPASVRIEPVKQVLRGGVRGLFIEKPVALDMDTAGVLLELVNGSGITTMVACNLRFDPRLKTIGREEPTTLILEMGQNFRHWSDEHQPISMILDSIHELDLANHINGRIIGLHGWSVLRRADLLVEHENGARSLIHLDRIADPPHRSVTSYEAHERIVANLWPTDPENYRREMEHFLECVEGGRETSNPLTQAVDVLGRALEVVG